MLVFWLRSTRSNLISSVHVDISYCPEVHTECGRTVKAWMIRLLAISVFRLAYMACLACVQLRRFLTYQCATLSRFPVPNFEFAIGLCFQNRELWFRDEVDRLSWHRLTSLSRPQPGVCLYWILGSQQLTRPTLLHLKHVVSILEPQAWRLISPESTRRFIVERIKFSICLN